MCCVENKSFDFFLITHNPWNFGIFQLHMLGYYNIHKNHQIYKMKMASLLAGHQSWCWKAMKCRHTRAFLDINTAIVWRLISLYIEISVILIYTPPWWYSYISYPSGSTHDTDHKKNGKYKFSISYSKCIKFKDIYNLKFSI